MGTCFLLEARAQCCYVTSPMEHLQPRACRHLTCGMFYLTCEGISAAWLGVSPGFGFAGTSAPCCPGAGRLPCMPAASSCVLWLKQVRRAKSQISASLVDRRPIPSQRTLASNSKISCQRNGSAAVCISSAQCLVRVKYWHILWASAPRNCNKW